MIWATEPTMCFRTYADSEGPDQAALFRAFAVRKPNHWIHVLHVQNVLVESKCPDETLLMFRMM